MRTQEDVEEAEDERKLTPGPMPVPSTENGAGARKKRRAVLPHERLFLEHLPDADRYYKSFMHRDSLNFVIMTK